MHYSHNDEIQAAFDLGYADGLSEAVRSMNTGVPITIVNRDAQLITLGGQYRYTEVLRAYAVGKARGLQAGIKK